MPAIAQETESRQISIEKVIPENKTCSRDGVGPRDPKEYKESATKDIFRQTCEVIKHPVRSIRTGARAQNCKLFVVTVFKKDNLDQEYVTDELQCRETSLSCSIYGSSEPLAQCEDVGITTEEPKIHTGACKLVTMKDKTQQCREAKRPLCSKFDDLTYDLKDCPEEINAASGWIKQCKVTFRMCEKTRAKTFLIRD